MRFEPMRGPLAYSLLGLAVFSTGRLVAGQEAAPPTALTLGRAVALALERNFALQGGADSLKTARARETVARAQFYPKLTPAYQHSSDNSAFTLEASQKLPWTGGILSSSAAVRSFSAPIAGNTSSSDVQLVFSQPLLRGFGPNATSFELVNSRRARQAQERSFELSRQRLAIDVTRAFYQVVQQRQLLAVAEQSLKRGEALQRASEARLRVGLVSKLDVFRAQLQAAQARESMVGAETALAGALEQFRLLLGVSPRDAVEPVEISLSEVGGQAGEPLEILIAQALARRLDLQEARDEEDDARRSANLARQNLFPQLDFNVAFSRLGPLTAASPAFPLADRRVSVFFSASYPIERSADRANKAVADLEQAARARGRRQQELQVESEVRAAVRELDRIRKSIDLQTQSVEIAEQQRRLATLRYDRGLASNFDVVDAEGSLVQAKSALVTLLASHQVARLDLLRVTGGLDVEKEFAP